jgi:hypothetical protein
MHSIPRQLATFAAVLAVLYTGGFIAGQFIETGHEEESHAESGQAEAGGHGGGHATGAEEPSTEEAAAAVRGLAVAEHGLRLELATPELARGRREQLRFAITDAAGRPVRDFDVAHERRMHLIVVRRDLTGFQHLHPELGADGVWTTPVRLPEAGSYRVFADFARDGRAITLGSDLRVDGDADLEPLAEPAATASAGDGYEVRLDARGANPGREAELAFAIRSRGEPVETEPYLGAGGHLVALREGDLAFLHVHPTEATTFGATFPTAGRYRLFLQFQHEGTVRTAAFTQPVR